MVINMYDVAVVGAGPAGAAAAYHLARAGHRVLVSEKALLPRYKPCGGGLSPQVQEWCDFDFSPVISAKVDTISYTYQFTDPVRAPLETPGPVWMVRRDLFDHFLVEQAVKAGAELWDQTEVLGVRRRLRDLRRGAVIGIACLVGRNGTSAQRDDSNGGSRDRTKWRSR